MSTNTSVFGLFKYDPATDGNLPFNITQALNNNWNKIDSLVLPATAAAAPYNPSGTYSIGDYCIYNGTLQKCNTPIPSGEAWNAEHWTETSVAAELAGKASAVPPEEQNLPLSSGWSVAENSMSIFYKTQEDIVHVILNAKTSSPVAESDTVATLPVTYRPNKFFRVPITCRKAGSVNFVAGHLDIGVDGAIRIYASLSGSEIIEELDVAPFAFPLH